MKIKRFVASNMRQALRMVRETLGEEAVILSNKSVEEGVELTAAVDLVTEEHTIKEAPRPEKTYSEASHLSRHIEESNRQIAEAEARELNSSPSISRRPAKKMPLRKVAEKSPVTNTQASGLEHAGALEEMRKEMHNMRQWMQAELSGISWNDLGQRSPHVQELMRRFMAMGVSADISRRLGERVRDQSDFKKAWKKSLYHMTEEIIVAEEDVVEQGGVVALVGPTGVGKTTTIAKMAARYALRHGNRHVALVTTDSYRIGARDQLQTYGRILNVPVRSATTAEEMDTVLTSLSDRSLVLVDTAGMGASDQKFDEQLGILDVIGDSLTTLLTLSATTDCAALERAMRLFESANPTGCIVTKLDEAASLGGVLSTLIHSGLPLTYTTDGQRVPEDMQPARAYQLLASAVSLMNENHPDLDPDYLAMAYGGAASHALI